MPVVLAVGISALVSLLAWRARALTGGGALLATAVGTSILSFTGWAGGAGLGAFFLSSTIVGRIGARRTTISEARGEQRDAVQVAANGGAAALGGLAGGTNPDLALWIVTGALAAAAADTWATSIGALSRSNPIHLATGRRVPRGTSGAISAFGTVGALAGSTLVGGAATLAGAQDLRFFLSGVGLGFGGMLLDSWLGARWQGRFECPACGTATERRIHRCGALTRHSWGWRWLDNDGVNAISTAVAALVGALAFVLLTS
ncbi:MAG: DUF92 domain-containing protein [Gemmatimonadales bacterium]|nr:DUF92 domain-containing protein [Gemmatimonadales bacterium]